MSKKTGTEVATKPAGALIEGSQMPAHIHQGNRGSENVTTNEMVIPRLGLLQALSPEINKRDAKYIEGAEQGGLINTATGELYGESVLFVPVFFRKEYVVWKDRKAGGGFIGAFSTESEADGAIAKQDSPKDFEAMETHQHFGMIVDPETGKLDQIVLSLNKSKLKASRKINTLVQMSGADRWARALRISSIPETSDKGDYYGFAVAVAGWVDEATYKAGEKLYEIVKSGAADVDRNGDEGGATAAPAAGSDDPTDL